MWRRDGLSPAWINVIIPNKDGSYLILLQYPLTQMFTSVAYISLL